MNIRVLALGVASTPGITPFFQRCSGVRRRPGAIVPWRELDHFNVVLRVSERTESKLLNGPRSGDERSSHACAREPLPPFFTAAYTHKNTDTSSSVVQAQSTSSLVRGNRKTARLWDRQRRTLIDQSLTPPVFHLVVCPRTGFIRIEDVARANVGRNAIVSWRRAIC